MASNCLFFHPQETKHTLVVLLSFPAMILFSMWKKTELEAAQCKDRLRLVEVNILQQWMHTDSIVDDLLLQVLVRK